jgi:FkbM family methyltransferase
MIGSRDRRSRIAGVRRALDILVKAWRYGLIVLDHPMEIPFLVRSIIHHRAHAGQLLRLVTYRKWFHSADVKTVIDVGAHQGEFASAIAALLPDARIYSFEPLPECFVALRRTMRKHPRFGSFMVALGDRQEETSMWRSGFSESSSLLPMDDLHKRAFPWTADLTPVRVTVEKLDSFLPDLQLEANVLLKIDVQGFESKVIVGAGHTLERVQYVLVEVSFRTLYQGQSSFHEVYEQLILRGFVFAGIMDQLSSPIDSSPLQADALFIRA